MGSFNIASHVDNILESGRLAYIIPDYYLTVYRNEGKLPRVDVISKAQRHIPHYLLYSAGGAVHSINSSQDAPSLGVPIDSQQAIKEVIQSATITDVSNLLQTEHNIRRPYVAAKFRSFVTRGHSFDGIRNQLGNHAATILDWEVAHTAFELYAHALAGQGMDASVLEDTARIAKQAANRHSRQFDSLAADAAAQGFRSTPPIDNYRSVLMEFFFAK